MAFELGYAIFEIILQIIQERNHLSKEDRQIIKDEVTNALVLTRNAIEQYENGIVDENSNVISFQWAKASRRISMINNQYAKEFAARLMEKSKYWSMPNSYNEDLIDQFKIRIDDIEQTMNDFVN